MSDRRPLTIRAAAWAGTAVRMTVRTARVLFGPAAAAAVSIGLGELAGHVFGRGLAPWVGLLVAGGFGLWMARELNSVPPVPPRLDEEL